MRPKTDTPPPRGPFAARVHCASWNPAPPAYPPSPHSMREVRPTKHPPHLVIRKPSVRVELIADRLEGLPLRIPRRQLLRPQERPLAPLRAPAETAHERLDLAERRLPRHALEQVHADVCAVPPVRR